MRLTYTPDRDLQNLGEQAIEPVVPGSIDGSGKSVELTHRESAPNGSLSLTPNQKLPEGSRRLRRRCLKHHQKRISCEEKDVRLANLGADIEPHTGSSQGSSPVGRLSKHFEVEWERTRASLPASMLMSVPIRPWAMDGKGRFHKWLKTSLLPTAGGEAQAQEVITRFCEAVGSRRVARPKTGQPVFLAVAKNIDRFNKPTPSTDVLTALSSGDSGTVRPRWYKG